MDVARRIDTQIGLLATSTSFMPKRYRLTHGVPMIRAAQAVVRDIDMADSFYPNTQANVDERKRWLTLAVADCNDLYDKVQGYLDVREAQQKRAIENGAPPLKIGGKGDFEQAIADIDREIGLLKGVRKRVRLVGRKVVE